MENDLKKSYKGLVLWGILLISSSVTAAIIFDKILPEKYMLYSSFSLTIIFINILFYIIYKTEYIYWINGVTYEDARKATSEGRKEFAGKHLEKFVNATLMWGLYGIAKYFFGINLIWDTFAFLMILIPSAISTVRIKLNQ